MSMVDAGFLGRWWVLLDLNQRSIDYETRLSESMFGIKAYPNQSLTDSVTMVRVLEKTKRKLSHKNILGDGMSQEEFYRAISSILKDIGENKLAKPLFKRAVHVA